METPKASAPAPASAPASTAARPASAEALSRVGTPQSREEILQTAASSAKREPTKLGMGGFQLLLVILTAFVGGYAFHWWKVSQQAKQEEAQGVIAQLQATIRDATNQIASFRTNPPRTLAADKGEEKSAPPAAPKEKATILGLVKNDRGEPVKGAKVRLGGASVRTRSNGTFSFPLYADEAELEVVAAGYLAIEQTVKASAPDITVVLSTGKTEAQAERPQPPPPAQVTRPE